MGTQTDDTDREAEDRIIGPDGETADYLKSTLDRKWAELKRREDD